MVSNFRDRQSLGITYMYTHAYIHTCIHTHTCTHLCTHTHTHTYAHTHTHTHTHTDNGGDAVDRALENRLLLPKLEEMEAVPTNSLGHDEWRRLKPRSNSRSRHDLPTVKVQDYCDRVPMYVSACYN